MTPRYIAGVTHARYWRIVIVLVVLGRVDDTMSI